MEDIRKEQLKAIIISSIATVLGVLFIVLKAEMIGMLQTIACFALLAFGIIEIVIYCFLNTEDRDYSKLIIGAIATALALLLIFVNILFIIILGLIVAFSGIVFIKSSIADKKECDKQWWISLLIGILFLILGIAVAVLYNFEVLKNIIMIIFGATLIIEGIMGFVFVFILHKVIRLNFGKKEKSANQESEVETESEEEKETEPQEVQKEKTQKIKENDKKIEEKSAKTTESVQKPQKTYKVVEEIIDPDDGGFV